MTHQFRAGTRSVTFVEQAIDSCQDPDQAIRKLVGGRNTIRDGRVSDLVFGPNQPLGHCLFRDKECPSDLDRRQSEKCAQGQRNLRLGWQRRMAAGKEQPQAIVGDPTVAGVISFSGVHVPGDLFDLGLAHTFATEPVIGSVSSRRLQPSRRIGRDTFSSPVLKGLGERVLRTFLGQVPVASYSNDMSDDPAPLAAECFGDRELGGGHISQTGLTSIVP